MAAPISVRSFRVRASPMDDPDVVPRVHRHADRRAEHPVVRQRLRPAAGPLRTAAPGRRPGPRAAARWLERHRAPPTERRHEGDGSRRLCEEVSSLPRVRHRLSLPGTERLFAARVYTGAVRQRRASCRSSARSSRCCWPCSRGRPRHPDRRDRPGPSSSPRASGCTCWCACRSRPCATWTSRTRGAGYLDLATGGPRAPDAAHAVDRRLDRALRRRHAPADPRVAAIRVSLPSDRSFAQLRRGPRARHRDRRCRPATELFWNQGLLDVLFEYPIQSDAVALLDPTPGSSGWACAW